MWGWGRFRLFPVSLFVRPPAPSVVRLVRLFSVEGRSLGEGGRSPSEPSERRHWEIENRLHHVRDVSYDEDRRRNHVKNLPRNLACLRNSAISIVRLRGQFNHLPQAHRHYTARQQDAIREVTRADF